MSRLVPERKARRITGVAVGFEVIGEIVVEETLNARRGGQFGEGPALQGPEGIHTLSMGHVVYSMLSIAKDFPARQCCT
jgi:hypothetical protein